MYELDFRGNGILVEQKKLHLLMNMPFNQFNLDIFHCMCILSGCDYLPSIPRIGLNLAQQFVTKTNEPTIYKVMFNHIFISFYLILYFRY